MEGERLEALLDALLASARKAGAESADALGEWGAFLSARARLGALESMERAESGTLGLRVLVGRRQASVATTRLEEAELPRLAERAVSMARSAPEDEWCGLAEDSLLARESPDLQLGDGIAPDESALRERALEAEAAAREVPGIVNSEGATAGWSRLRRAYARSDGFALGYEGGAHEISCSVLAERNGAMERDYAYDFRRHFADLDAPEEVGREAAQRAVARVGARKPQGARLPVVYDERIASSLLRHFAQAVSAASVARGESFLGGQMGERVFPEDVNIVDDPFRPRGLASRPCDDEGVVGAKRLLVEKGVLTSWLADSASGRQLAIASTGHAHRSAAAPSSPAPTNMYVSAGDISREALMSDIEQGFLAMELMGHGVNPVTGDYSLGAAGFWIEKGAAAFPVHEVTIAGNLRDMFARMTAADDLNFRGRINAPSLRIEGMTIAGL